MVTETRNVLTSVSHVAGNHDQTHDVAKAVATTHAMMYAGSAKWKEPPGYRRFWLGRIRALLTASGPAGVGTPRFGLWQRGNYRRVAEYSINVRDVQMGRLRGTSSTIRANRDVM